MRTGYSHYRRQHPTMRKKRSATFMGWLLILFIVAGVAAFEAFKPLPSNLDALVVSDGAVARLHQAAQGVGR